jgi:2-polyprenyl-3-methyl-5-hydroxy-6-metoxy-1,4-benzoquinol methylase
MGSWEEYFAASYGKPVHPLYRKLPVLDRQRALELGAGVGTGVRFLLDQGLRVTAVDAEPQAIQILRRDCPEATVIEGMMEECNFDPQDFHLVVAGFSLFFLDEVTFPQMLIKIKQWVKPGGYFMAQFLGRNDDWAKLGYLAHTEEEILRMIRGFSVHTWEEVEKDGYVHQGEKKHWHVYHAIFQRSML